MKLLKFIFYVALSTSWLITSAQTDTKFWFVAPEVSQMHGDNPIYLRISTTDQPANIIVSEPANAAGFAPIIQNINANSTVTIDLSLRINKVENRPADNILPYGILIESDVPVTAYYEVASGVNPEIFPLKGKNALGKEFLIPSQNNCYNMAGSEACHIVATEDGTEITIVPKINVIGHAAGTPFTITLNKGQTYCIRVTDSTNTNPSISLGGTSIKSNKKIAVTIIDDSVRLSPAGNGWDLIGDQIVPVNLLGESYIVIKGNANIDLERVFILGTKNNTDIYINGSPTPVTNIDSSETYTKSFTTGNTLYITASNPIYVYHLSGLTYETGSALIPPLYCTGSRQIGFVRTNASTFWMMILTKDANKGNFLFNGSNTLITAADFSYVPGTNNEWVYYRKDMTGPVPTGANIIGNTSGLFHFGILNATGPSAEYGYYSDYSTLGTLIDSSFCLGDSAELIPTLTGTGLGYEYLWNDSTTNATKIAKNDGLYWVQTTFENCVIMDTFNIHYHPIPDAIFTTDPEIASLSNATIISINNSQNEDLCSWDFGDGNTSTDCNNPSHTYLNDGYYDIKLIITTNEGCMDSIIKTVHIVEDSLVFPNVFTPNGDGVNDYFEIKNIEKYLTSNVVILNRWGKKVYEANNYNNSTVRWEAKGADDGVYYYIAKYHGYLKDGETSGTVTVIR